jgi:hypothetical protein
LQKGLKNTQEVSNLLNPANLPSGTENLSQTRWRLLSTFMQAKFPSHETYWQRGKTKKAQEHSRHKKIFILCHKNVNEAHKKLSA